MGVHVVLVSLFGRLTVWSIFHCFGRAQENCPVSKTREFLFVQSFLKIGHSLISRLDKKNYVRGQQKMTWDWTNFFGWPKKMRNWLDTWETERLTKTTWCIRIVPILMWFWFCPVNFSFFGRPKEILIRLRDRNFFVQFRY